jgi:NDP-sugar pyrophosphorylase family protein
MRAMILAAGLGTRLRPLTNVLPKPAVPFFDRPLAAHVLRHLAAAGVSDIVMNAHHLGDKLEPALRPFVPQGVTLEVVVEERLLGTGGGVKAAFTRQSARLGPPADDEPLLLVNGDVLFFPDLGATLAHHALHGALATMVVRAHPEAVRLGAIEVEEGAVRRILGAPATSPAAQAFMFTGVHVLSGRALGLLPDEGCIVRRGYLPWLAAGERIAGRIETVPFRDCGTLAEYRAAHLDVLDGVVALPIGRDARGWVDPSARVEGDVVESVIGAGAHVAPGVVVRRSIVWPGEQVLAGVDDAVIACGLVLPAQ